MVLQNSVAGRYPASENGLVQTSEQLLLNFGIKSRGSDHIKLKALVMQAEMLCNKLPEPDVL